MSAVPFLISAVTRDLKQANRHTKCVLSERDASKRFARWLGGVRAGCENERLAESLPLRQFFNILRLLKIKHLPRLTRHPVFHVLGAIHGDVNSRCRCFILSNLRILKTNAGRDSKQVVGHPIPPLPVLFQT